tara:strand:- start:27916 stop:28170 length:255 start_codon:yes stop_codon:yes gene_type:complete
MLNKKSKAEYITDFVKAQSEVEACIKPYKEDLKDLKRNYVDNGWLSKDEIKMAVKALRLLKDDTNFDMLGDYYNQVEKALRDDE